MSSRQKRRASDSMSARLQRPPNSGSAFIGGGILLAFLVAWFAWQGWNRLEPVREGAPSWTPDGRIVFYVERAGQADLFIMNADGSGRRPLLESEADEGAPAMSTDGRLAFDSDVDGNYEIYVLDADGETEHRVTNHPGRDVAPTWSPDGSRIVFMSTRDSPEFHLYSVRPDGTGLERLTTEPSNWFPQFSRDGTRLAFHRWRDLHVRTIGNSQVNRLTTDPLNGMYPTWSPDGMRLAFMTSRNGPMEIYTMSAFGGEQERLVTMPRGGAIDPRWSPDGEFIVFVHVSEETPDEGGGTEASRVIYSVELATGRLRRLSP